MRIVTQKVSDLNNLGSTATGTFRPLVPRDLRRQVFDDAAHPGMRVTHSPPPGTYGRGSLITSPPWRGPSCTASGPKSTATYRYHHNTYQFPRIGLDTSMWTWKATFQHPQVSLTIMDRATHWLEAVHITATTTVDYANTLFQRLVSRFSFPAVITSELRCPVQLLPVGRLVQLASNVQQVQTSAYHLQSYGLMERFHRRLRARCAVDYWTDHLPWIPLGQ
jgi:hypothetical protein